MWQRCECCNNVLSSFWLPWLARTWTIEQRGLHVTCALIGTRHKLAAYEQPSALNGAWVRAGGCKRSLPRYPKVGVEPATRSAVATCNIQLEFLKFEFCKLHTNLTLTSSLYTHSVQCLLDINAKCLLQPSIHIMWCYCQLYLILRITIIACQWLG